MIHAKKIMKKPTKTGVVLRFIVTPDDPPRVKALVMIEPVTWVALPEPPPKLRVWNCDGVVCMIASVFVRYMVPTMESAPPPLKSWVVAAAVRSWKRTMPW